MVEKKKLYYSISEVSQRLDVKPHVLRYWESQFRMLRPKKNRAGNRSYRDKDLEILEQIKELLYDRRFTIEGARKELQDRRKNGGATELSDAASASGDGSVSETSDPAGATQAAGQSSTSAASTGSLGSTPSTSSTGSTATTSSAASAASTASVASPASAESSTGNGSSSAPEDPAANTSPSTSPEPAKVLDLAPIRELRSEIVELKEWLESRRGESA